MSAWAVFRVKDEADVIAQSVAWALEQFDHVLVADNGSTDGTVEIVEQLGVELVHDPEVGYYQSAAMSALADVARVRGAQWVVCVDADEFWCADEGTVAERLAALPAEALIAQAPLFDHVATPGHALSPWRRTAPAPLPKVAFRAVPGLVVGQGNHSVSFPDVRDPLTVTGALEVRHFAIRSPEQMIRKARNGAAAYAATDLPADVGAHWRQWGALSDEQLREVFATYYHSAHPAADELIYDPVPCLASAL